MKNILVLAIITLVSFSFAANERFYIEDHSFDYSLEDITDLKGNTLTYDFKYDEDRDIKQATGVKVYTHFDTTQPGGQLRIYLNTKDSFEVGMPTVLVTVPKDSSEIEDISSGIEVINTGNKTTGIKLSVSGSLEDITTLYIQTFEDLDFSVTKPDADKDTYMISLKDGTYSVDFAAVEDTNITIVTIAGQ